VSTKPSGILVPGFLFILFRQWKHVFYFVAWERRTGTKQSCILAGDIRILEQHQLVMTAPTTYGLGFRHANTFWKTPGVYFHMHQNSSPYLVGAGHNHYFGVETFFCQRCCDTLFWPIWPCIMLSSIWTRPRVGA
jgi:hypothetical protein